MHLAAGITAGIVTSTATNPIWLIKTRLQLDKKVAAQKAGVNAVTSTSEAVAAAAAGARQYRNSVDCIRQVFRDEGFRGFFKGMSASYLGATESTLQWVLYEQMKKSLRHREERIAASGREKTWWDHTVEHTGKAGAAGGAKFVAAMLAYPHEVSGHYEGTKCWTGRTDNLPTGRENKVTTSTAGRWPAKIHWLDSMFQAGLERGGHAWPIRRAHASFATNGAECCYHVWHVRGVPEIIRHPVVKQRLTRGGRSSS